MDKNTLKNLSNLFIFIIFKNFAFLPKSIISIFLFLQISMKNFEYFESALIIPNELSFV